MAAIATTTDIRMPGKFVRAGSRQAVHALDGFMRIAFLATSRSPNLD
jgi:hypothetical protein